MIHLGFKRVKSCPIYGRLLVSSCQTSRQEVSRSRFLPVAGVFPASCSGSGLSVPLRSLIGANKVNVA